MSLLVRHAEADLSGLSDAIALPAFRTWNKGDPITTPKGRRVGGTYPDSRWNYIWPRRRGAGIAIVLSEVIDVLTPRREVLRQLRASGGVPQVIASVAGLGHVGCSLDSELLWRLSELGVGLGGEYFVEPQTR